MRHRLSDGCFVDPGRCGSRSDRARPGRRLDHRDGEGLERGGPARRDGHGQGPGAGGQPDRADRPAGPSSSRSSRPGPTPSRPSSGFKKVEKSNVILPTASKVERGRLRARGRQRHRDGHSRGRVGPAADPDRVGRTLRHRHEQAAPGHRAQRPQHRRPHEARARRDRRRHASRPRPSPTSWASFNINGTRNTAARVHGRRRDQPQSRQQHRRRSSRSTPTRSRRSRSSPRTTRPSTAGPAAASSR